MKPVESTPESTGEVADLIDWLEMDAVAKRGCAEIFLDHSKKHLDDAARIERIAELLAALPPSSGCALSTEEQTVARGALRRSVTVLDQNPSSGLQAADVAFTGPVDGMGDADPSGAYLLLHITRKDGSQERLKVSVGGAEWVAAELVGIIDAPEQPPSSGWEAGAEAGARDMRERCAYFALSTGMDGQNVRTMQNLTIRALPLPPPPSKEGV